MLQNKLNTLYLYIEAIVEIMQQTTPNSPSKTKQIGIKFFRLHILLSLLNLI